MELGELGIPASVVMYHPHLREDLLKENFGTFHPTVEDVTGLHVPSFGTKM